MWRSRFALLGSLGILGAASVLTACGSAGPSEPHSTSTPPPPLTVASTPPQDTAPQAAADSPAMVSTPPGDTDADGLADDVDRCPDTPEDRDGFQDEGGCPDPDNDGDGVADINDKCPNEPETLDGFEDEDGCPDSARPVAATAPGATAAGRLAVLGPRSIQLRQPVAFSTGKAAIDPASYPTLDAVAGILTRQPSLRIEVGVHSDGMGSSAANQALTEARAGAVVDYLLAKGIRANRLSAVGYGEAKPIADNATAAGRAANRRVELLIR